MLRIKNGGRRPPTLGDHIIRPVFDGRIKTVRRSFLFFSRSKINERSQALFGDDLWVGKVGGTKMEVQEF